MREDLMNNRPETPGEPGETARKRPAAAGAGRNRGAGERSSRLQRERQEKELTGARRERKEARLRQRERKEASLRQQEREAAGPRRAQRSLHPTSLTARRQKGKNGRCVPEPRPLRQQWCLRALTYTLGRLTGTHFLTAQ